MRKFIILTSHKLVEEQIVDAKDRYGVQEFVYLPTELQSLWSNVPADLDSLENYSKPLKSWLEDVTHQGDVVMIQGDFGLSYNLIDYAKSLGLVTVYATTKRDSVEKDGVKISIFKHIRFREYREYREETMS